VLEKKNDEPRERLEEEKREKRRSSFGVGQEYGVTDRWQGARKR